MVCGKKKRRGAELEDGDEEEGDYDEEDYYEDSKLVNNIYRLPPLPPTSETRWINIKNESGFWGPGRV